MGESAGRAVDDDASPAVQALTDWPGPPSSPRFAMRGLAIDCGRAISAAMYQPSGTGLAPLLGAASTRLVRPTASIRTLPGACPAQRSGRSARWPLAQCAAELPPPSCLACLAAAGPCCTACALSSVRDAVPWRSLRHRHPRCTPFFASDAVSVRCQCGWPAESAVQSGAAAGACALRSTSPRLEVGPTHAAAKRGSRATSDQEALRHDLGTTAASLCLGVRRLCRGSTHAAAQHAVEVQRACGETDRLRSIRRRW